MNRILKEKQFSAQAGFTLVELLIGMLLMSIILGVILNIFQSSASGTAKLNLTSDAQQEALNGLQIISSRLKEAWYIYTPGTTVTLPTSDYIKNPMPSGGNAFVVGTDPVLAMVLPPMISSGVCTPASSPPVTDGCYRFYAYYGMKRADWVTAATGFRDPGADSPGLTTWVVAEYRSFFAATPTIVNGGTPPAVPAATLPDNVNLLVEDIVPATGGAAPDYKLFTAYTATVTTPDTYMQPTWPLTYVNRVQQDLRVTQKSGNLVTVLPSSTTTYQLNIYPENIGRNGM